MRPKPDVFDPPTQLALDFHNRLIFDEYDCFNAELSYKEDLLSKEEFEELRDTYTESSFVRSSQLFEYSDGKMLLLEIRKHSDGYKVMDVIQVPEEVRFLFPT